MNGLARIFRILFSIYAIIIFLALMFLLLPFALVSAGMGEEKGGRWIYRVVTFWADAAMFFWMMPHRNLYEAPHQKDEPLVILFNHVSYMDIPVMLKTFKQQPIRILGKAEMAKVPVFGIFYRQAVIPVKRDSAINRAKSLALLREAIQKHISVLIAPEGTFNMTHEPLKSFYDGAFRIALETGTDIKPVLFLDTYDRMHYRSVFSMTPGRSRSVFLEKVSVQGLTMHDLPALKQKVFDQMEAALIRYKASWIHALPH